MGSSDWSSDVFSSDLQIVGNGREGEGQVDASPPAEPGLTQSGHGLDPAERLLDLLADALAGGIAGMAGGAPVDRRAPATGILRQMRAQVKHAQFPTEVPGAAALVGAGGARAARPAHVPEHLHRRPTG